MIRWIKFTHPINVILRVDSIDGFSIDSEYNIDGYRKGYPTYYLNAHVKGQKIRIESSHYHNDSELVARREELINVIERSL